MHQQYSFNEVLALITTGKRTALAGLWFHSTEDGSVVWQGRILRGTLKSGYRVQLYSWADGAPTDIRHVELAEMADWKFYESDQAMRRSYNREMGVAGDD